MKTAKEFFEEFMGKRIADADKYILMLQSYGETVVEQCAHSFEYDMEWDGSMHPDGEVREIPVLSQHSVNSVKKLITNELDIHQK